MKKKTITLEDVITRLEELKSGLLRNELHIARIEARLVGENVGDSPVTRAEVRTDQQVQRLCDDIENLQKEGLL